MNSVKQYTPLFWIYLIVMMTLNNLTECVYAELKSSSTHNTKNTKIKFCGKPYPHDIKELQCAYLRDQELSVLKSFKSLKKLSLTIDTSKHIHSLKKLKVLQTLESLSLKINHPINLTPLRDLKHLHTLILTVIVKEKKKSQKKSQKKSLKQNQSTAKKPQSESPTLIFDLEPLTQITQLHTLTLINGGQVELQYLSPLKQLKSLKLTKVKISSECLSKMTELTQLTFESMNLNSLKPITSLIHLEELTFDHLLIDSSKELQSHLSHLFTLKKLKKLSIHGGQLSDLSPLAKMGQLNELSLKKTKVSHFEPLAQMTSLTVLDLSYTSFQDVSILTSLKSLKQLDLRYTSVQQVSPLVELKQLLKLDLSFTQVEDVRMLSQRDGLTLSFKETPADPFEIRGFQSIDLTKMKSALGDFQTQCEIFPTREPLSELDLPTVECVDDVIQVRFNCDFTTSQENGELLLFKAQISSWFRDEPQIDQVYRFDLDRDGREEWLFVYTLSVPLCECLSERAESCNKMDKIIEYLHIFKEFPTEIGATEIEATEIGEAHPKKNLNKNSPNQNNIYETILIQRKGVIHENSGQESCDSEVSILDADCDGDYDLLFHSECLLDEEHDEHEDYDGRLDEEYDDMEEGEEAEEEMDECELQIKESTDELKDEIKEMNQLHYTCTKERDEIEVMLSKYQESLDQKNDKIQQNLEKTQALIVSLHKDLYTSKTLTSQEQKKKIKTRPTARSLGVEERLRCLHARLDRILFTHEDLKEMIDLMDLTLNLKDLVEFEEVLYIFDHDAKIYDRD